MSLANVITETLSGGGHFLQGVHFELDDVSEMLEAIIKLEGNLRSSRSHSYHAVSASLRQTLLMMLIPSNAFDDAYTGSIDKAIAEHLAELDVSLPPSDSDCLRNICINIRKLRGMSGPAARRATKSLAEIRGMPKIYSELVRRQNNRCVWCGVPLDASDIKLSLEHMAPKHIGDDMNDASNWAIACTTCNSGKGEVLSWAASPFAFGYLRGRHFVDPKRICMEARWIVLVRDRGCEKCGKGPTDVELGIYRRITTGLPIPQNCSCVCVDCVKVDPYEVLIPEWEISESARSFP